MYACKIQNWKFDSVLITACPADSRKAYCKVCNNAIIDRFLKDRNNTENLSEWTLFGAVNTLQRQGSTIPFKIENAPSFKQSSSIRNAFHFFSSEMPCKIIFTML